MESNTALAAWGTFFAGMMYVIGNGIWVNHFVRAKPWRGWMLWGLAAALFLVLGAYVEGRLGAEGGILQRLSQADPENHWIVLTLFALMSIPGAAAVILRQDARMTRIILIAPALCVFTPAGQNLAGGGIPGLAAGLGVGLSVGAVCYLWQAMLDQAEAS